MFGVFVVPGNIFKVQIKQEQSCVTITKDGKGEQPVIPILVVEDDENLNRAVCPYLKSSSLEAAGCLNTGKAYEEIYRRRHELIISDIMMPGTDGFEFAKSVRGVNKTIPVLFMSTRDDLPSRQRGFQLGIDSYMMKPIELDELLLCVRALPRQASIGMEGRITVGNLELNVGTMTMSIDGKEISTTTGEFHILCKLLSYPGKTLSRAQLVDEFWGVDMDSSLQAVDAYITKLRDKSSQCSGLGVKTIRGVGYKAVLR